MRPIRLMRFFIFLILATTAGTARAAEVAIPFTLAAGDSHRLAVTLTQERYQRTESLMAITASAFVDVAVLGSRGSDLIVAWTYRDLQVEGGGSQAKLFRDLFGVLEGQRIEYYLDQDGIVVGLHNLDDVLAMNRRFVDEFTASLSDQLGNAELAAIPGMGERLLPLRILGEQGAERGNIATLRRALAHLRAGGLLGIFPAGAVAHWHWESARVEDPPWPPHAARLIRKSGADIVFYELDAATNYRIEFGESP